jgi:hypothetical protein
MVNDFQSILIGNFENNVPTIYIGNRPKYNNWIRKGIKLTCKKKDSFTFYTEIQISC